MMQRYAELTGEDGCYLFSILHHAEEFTDKQIDHLRAYMHLRELKYKDWHGRFISCIEPDCYINFPDKIMSFYTGTNWKVSKQDVTYKPKEGELLIGRFERKVGRKVIAHFVCLNSNKEVSYDPYEGSLTVQNGKLVSLRVFTKE